MVGNQPSGSMPTTIDSVEEFKVSTSDQTADFSSSGRCEARTLRNGIHADPSNGTTTYNLNALDPRNTGIDSVAQQVWNRHMLMPTPNAGCGPFTATEFATAPLFCHSSAGFLHNFVVFFKRADHSAEAPMRKLIFVVSRLLIISSVSWSVLGHGPIEPPATFRQKPVDPGLLFYRYRYLQRNIQSYRYWIL